MELDTFIKCY